MLRFNPKKYYNYEEITEFLQTAADEYPDFVTLESIGVTPEKRKIWMVSLTDKKTGSPEEKPGLWVDGNTHASEITGAQSALYFIYNTLTGYKKNSELRFLLNRMSFYLLPQVSPDGAEFFHRNKHEIRSSPMAWPHSALHENLIPQDINGDGEILLMRKEDASGGFKKSSTNPELLVQRKAFDLPSKKEKFYKLFKEGLFKNFDGFNESFETAHGLDFNRQFPGTFRPEGMQKGAGPHTMASIEIRSFIEAFISKQRIFAHISLHTYGGLILRPPGAVPEETFHPADLQVAKIMTDEAARVSGYTAISTAQDFKYYSRESETGTADDWSFEHRGVFSFTVEIWDVWKAAGLKLSDHVSRYFNPAESDLLKIFKWAKAKLQMKNFYSPWKKFNHPQLGDVEIGGWKTNFLFRNPPAELLKGEMQKVNDIILQTAKILPLVEIKKVEVTPIDTKTKHLVVITENQGFLPTYGSQQAMKVGAVTKPTVTLKMSSKIKLISGKKHFEIPPLQGRDRFIPIHTPVSMTRDKNTEQTRFEWIVQGEGAIELTFDYQRGGVIRTQVQV